MIRIFHQARLRPNLLSGGFCIRPIRFNSTPASFPTSVDDLPSLTKSLVERAETIKKEHKELSEKLSNDYIPDLQIKYDNYTNILGLYDKLNRHRLEYEELVSITDDPDLYREAQEELQTIVPEIEKLVNELRVKLEPPVKYAEKGVGGNEASLFTADLLNMYLNFASEMKWKHRIISEGSNAGGFLNEAILCIDTLGSYDIMRHESGVHRVQRIPETETKGRVHTSTAAVVVLPKLSEGNESSLKEDERVFAPGEVRIDTMRASGKGGQHVNTTDSAVRLVHIPTGLIVTQQDERSQPLNKAKAFAVLRSRLAQMEQEQEMQRQKNLRLDQVSSTDRSDKIKTYNFKENRVTDHRINYSLHDLPGVLSGKKLGQLIDVYRYK
ncbi:Peptide chain release factor 1, mitochondrial [Candida viswanathii]|uniref:Peptide chain release factor 1, mitochondrial n=1 Tax=Candida viswanathii TaxID=5486 RepID=A0A367Y123_9ASCO|nr:Peptide chain release factor 1, mitochondrial [Candida viswanathii]